MELRDFAEQILFATTLEEKLQSPEVITDERPGSPLLTPDAPGRPAELQFKAQGSGKADFPGVHRLEREEERGRLLHFFANHELLATELMALALLRFPDAPAAFRRGLLQTLKDEQEHTRLYIERMRQCGIHFGELPVSGYFWRSVASMESPMDYVSRLCSDVRAGEPRFLPPLRARVSNGGRCRHGEVARKNLSRRNRPRRLRLEMVSSLEKSGRERLGGVLPAIEISALAAARERDSR